MMQSSNKQHNREEDYEATTRKSRQKGSIENRSTKNQTHSRGQTRVAGLIASDGDFNYRTPGNHCSEERESRVTGGILEQLINDSLDQLQDTRDSIKRLQCQEKRIQQRISNLEDLKKLTED